MAYTREYPNNITPLGSKTKECLTNGDLVGVAIACEYGGTVAIPSSYTSTSGGHGHSISISYSGGNAAFDNRPSFYTLAFVKKIK